MDAAHPDRKTGRSGLWLGLVAMSVTWTTALAVDSAARLAAGMYTKFGTDLPTPTLALIDAARHNLPWIWAGLCTLVLLYVMGRATRHLAMACALVMAATSTWASVAAIVLLMPTSLCGDFWPDWPATAQAGASARPHLADERAGAKGCSR